jgi:SEC-C motif-containing protein
MADCPCGSGKTYGRCCKPFIDGKKKPPTAEGLMRSRYTAFTQSDAKYLTSTLHPDQREGHDEAETKDWADRSEWMGFELVEAVDGGKDDDTGTIEFIAKYKVDGKVVEHHEKAEFEKVDDEWVFTDGQLVKKRPMVRDAPKIGRNDPCPCGSGKKYKKCCMP